MRQVNFFLRVLAVSAVSSLAAATLARAASYPFETIKILVPYAAGGSDDLLARIIAHSLAIEWHAPVVVENHPGVGGIIAMNLLARSKPDGYTIAVADSGQLAIAPNIYPKLSYRPLQDLAPVVNFVSSQRMLAVRPGLPVESVRQLIALAKKEPGKLMYASTGSGGSAFLNMELFKSLAGIKVLQIPYRGGAGNVEALLEGHVDMTVLQVGSVAALAKAGKLRLIATTSSKRSSMEPNLPTMPEAGVKGYSCDIWVGVVAPAQTPRSIINKLNSGIIAAEQSPPVRQRLLDLGYTPIGDTPEQFRATIQADTERFAQIIKSADIAK